MRRLVALTALGLVTFAAGIPAIPGLNGDAARRRRRADLWRGRSAYFTCDTIHSTVALTCSSVRAGLPPRAGIMPALPV